jgi:hypothetical protein
MNTSNSTETTAAGIGEGTDIDLASWCAEVRRIHDEIKPIGDDDPRRLDLGMDFLDDPQLRAERWFEVRGELPRCPLPAPYWAVGQSVSPDDYPSVHVEWHGEPVIWCGAEIRVVASHNIAVDTYDDRYEAGVIWHTEEAGVEIPDLEPVQPPEDARTLAAAIATVMAKAGI